MIGKSSALYFQIGWLWSQRLLATRGCITTTLQHQLRIIQVSTRRGTQVGLNSTQRVLSLPQDITISILQHPSILLNASCSHHSSHILFYYLKKIIFFFRTCPGGFQFSVEFFNWQAFLVIWGNCVCFLKTFFLAINFFYNSLLIIVSVST